jgi:hypothetical protein
MVWFFVIFLLGGWIPEAQAGSEPTARVPISGEFFGARFSTHLDVQRTALTRHDRAKDTLLENSRELQDMRRWIEMSQGYFDFDDYGVFRVVEASIDGMGLKVIKGNPKRYRTVSQALSYGFWSENERLLAIAGALKAVGYSVALFEYTEDTLILGLGTQDPNLNVASVSLNWLITSSDGEAVVPVEWILWDGKGRIGRLDSFETEAEMDRLKRLYFEVPDGKYFSFMERVQPAFTRRNETQINIPVMGTEDVLSLRHFPDMADWFSLYPEFEFERQVQFVSQEREYLKMGPSIRRVLASSSSEEEAVNRILRTIQSHFVYEEGPLRTMSEVMESRRADCDQMAMLMLISLLEMGFKEDDVVSINWPKHLALGIRAHDDGPDGGVVVLETGRYHILDLTYYLYEGKKLTSAWGKTSDKYGSSVTVGTLAAIRPQS